MDRFSYLRKKVLFHTDWLRFNFKRGRRQTAGIRKFVA